MKTIQVCSNLKEEFIDITSTIKEIVASSGIKTGSCLVYVPHTTAGITINENADPSVRADIISALKNIVPDSWPYKHLEGNSPAHIKASLIGSAKTIMIEDGKLALGTWQGIFFCEFDGPRTRKVYIKLFSD
ncbi:MAG: secondary thiamine-phosphate synthase enzyme YjbQ [Candidatus Aminicenantales bacterium]